MGKTQNGNFYCIVFLQLFIENHLSNATLGNFRKYKIELIIELHHS